MSPRDRWDALEWLGFGVFSVLKERLQLALGPGKGQVGSLGSRWKRLLDSNVGKGGGKSRNHNRERREEGEGSKIKDLIKNLMKDQRSNERGQRVE